MQKLTTMPARAMKSSFSTAKLDTTAPAITRVRMTTEANRTGLSMARAKPGLKPRTSIPRPTGASTIMKTSMVFFS
ncbi:hypothetical protein D3C85_940420 [compost metagenome]